MPRPIVLALGFLISSTLFAAQSVLERGNELLAKGNAKAAEGIFRDALRKEPDNAVYRAQLGLSLVLQQRYGDAELELDKLLKSKPNDPAALWYKAQNSFAAGRHREAIARYRAVLPLLDQESPQVYAAYWFIGTSWRALLYLKVHTLGAPPPGDSLADMGLAYNEVDEMIAAYKTYLDLQPQASDRRDIQQFLAWVALNRPPENAKKWLISPTRPQ